MVVLFVLCLFGSVFSPLPSPSTGITSDIDIDSSSSSSTSFSSSTISSPPTYMIETYGCQMNVNDTEIIHRVLQDAGYVKSKHQTTRDRTKNKQQTISLEIVSDLIL